MNDQGPFIKKQVLFGTLVKGTLNFQSQKLNQTTKDSVLAASMN